LKALLQTLRLCQIQLGGELSVEDLQHETIAFQS
jgi:hypothetical protein